MKKALLLGLILFSLGTSQAFAYIETYSSRPIYGNTPVRSNTINNGFYKETFLQPDYGRNNFYNRPYYNNQRRVNRYYNPYRNNYYSTPYRNNRYIRPGWGFFSKAESKEVKVALRKPSDINSDANIHPVSYPKISQVEKAIFGKTYDKQDIAERLNRLEQSIFGSTYTNLSLAQRVDNIISNYNRMNDWANISKNDLAKMERMVFNRNYSADDTESRIMRLEEAVFGAVRGGELDARYETLKTAVNNQGINPNSYPACTAGMQSGWRGVLSGLGNMLTGNYGGVMTGYTPQIVDPYYNNYDNLRGIGSHGVERGIQTNRGWAREFQDTGSSAGVTILD